MSRLAFLFVTVSAITMGAMGAEPAKLKPPIVETLPNGLEVAWFPDPKVPLVDIGLFFWSGSVDDAANKSGTAQLLSSCLFRGAAGMTAQELAHATEKLGASRYSTSNEDDLALGFHGLSDDAPELLALLAKVAIKPDFPEKEVEEQKARTVDRWRHIGDYGDAAAELAFSRRMMAGSPYGRGSILSIAEYKKLNRNDLVAFHKEYFRPRNAILLISGRADPEKLRPIILREFGSDTGSWQGSLPAPENSRASHAEPRIAQVKERVLLIHRPNLNQASVRLGFHAPLLNSPDHYPLFVLNALLGQHFGSRLNTLLRDKLGLTYSIGSSFSFERELTVFSISSNTRNESAAELIAKTLDVLKDLKAGNVSADEVAVAKEYLVGTFAIASASPSSSVSRWLSGKQFSMGPDYLNEFIPKIRAVTPEQVIAAAKAHLKPETAWITVAGDITVLEKDLSKRKLGPARRLTLQDLL